MGKNESRGLTLKQSYRMNTLFLMAHIAYFVWYYFEKMPILFYYNLVSISVFAAGYFILAKLGTVVMTWLDFIEIFIFMTMNMVCLGWSYGFQFFCVGFALSGLLTDFYFNHKRKITTAALASMAFLILYYAGFYIWCHGHAPVYTHGNAIVRMVVYLSNALTTILLILGLLRASMNQVYTLEEKLEDAAVHDVLTGLYNRRYMQDLLIQWKQGASARTTGEAPWMAILDIDHFKNVNDTYGHFAGDFVLKRLGQALLALENRYPGLTASRWGGEEFGLFYQPRTAEESAGFIRMLEDFRLSFRSEKHRFEGLEISCSVTTGAARVEGADIDAAQKRADARLYWGKEHGRDQVVSADPAGD